MRFTLDIKSIYNAKQIWYLCLFIGLNNVSITSLSFTLDKGQFRCYTAVELNYCYDVKSAKVKHFF